MKTDRPARQQTHNNTSTLSTESTSQPGQPLFSEKHIPKTRLTYTPHFLPRPLQSPLVGYLAGLVLQMLVAIGLILLMKIYPAFQFTEALTLLVILLVALSWGVGPSLIATLAGAVVLAFLTLPPYFSLGISGTDNKIGIILFIIVSLTISLLASQTQRARLALENEQEDLRKSEQEAQLHAQQLEAIFDAITDSLFILGPRGTAPRSNQAGRDLLDLPAGMPLEGTGAPPFDLLDEDERPLPYEAWPETRLRRGESIQGEDAIEVLLLTNSQRKRYISMTGAPIREPDGAITGAVLVCRDITERKRIEREARARASELEALFEAMTDGVFVYGADGHLLQTNKAARSLLARYFKSEDLSLTLEDRIKLPHTRSPEGDPLSPEQVPSMRLLHGEVLTGANTADIVLRTFTNEDLWLNMSGTPLRDEEGHITGALAIAHDVTSRRQLEQRTRHVLKALLQMAQIVVQGATSPLSPIHPTSDHSHNAMQRMAELTLAVLGCDRLGMYRIEPESERLRPLAVVGLPPEQEEQWWREQENMEVRLSDSSAPELVERMRANEILMLDMTQPPYNAQPNPYGVRQMLVAPMVLGSQLLGYLTLDYGGRDHTYTPEELALTRAVTELVTLVMERERLQAETAQAQANELAAVAANQLKDEFIGIAGHELRTPITTMKANLQLARRRLNKLLRQHNTTEEQALQLLEQLLERAERQLERQNRLVSDLLDVSRLEQGHLELRIEEGDLVAMVREAVEEQQQIAPDRTIVVDLPSTAIPVAADRDRISQVVSNYLSNALKYSEADRPVEVQIAIRDGAACVSVRDQGPGLAPDVQQHIWERFYRVPGIEVQSGSGVGLGLGLHISRIIIDRQGGPVGIDSEQGKGSTFWFTLPILGE